jgi:hypothetical protein
MMVFMMDLIRQTNLYNIDKFTAMNNLILITKDIPKKIAIIIVFLVSNAVAHDVYLQGQHRGYETCRQYVSFNTLQIENLIYAYLEDGDGTHNGGVGSPPRFGPSFVEISDWLVENMPYDRYDNWLGSSDGVSTLPKKMDCTRKSYAQNNGPYWMHRLGSPFSARLIHGRYWSASAKPEKYPRSSILKITKSMWTGYGLDASYATHSVEIPECVVLTIPANSLKSDTHDFNNKFTLKNEFNIHSYEFIQVDVTLIPLDLDIEYASQTGLKELEESKEDTGDGGYISLKSQTNMGEDITPTTYLVIRPTYGLPSNKKVRLKFNSGGRYYISRNRLGTDLIISELTEFPAGQETRLYLVGGTRSQTRGGESITMQVNNNGTWIDGDSLNATVVQTQFQIDLRVFIPYNWVNIPLHLRVAGGDTRNYNPQLNGGYRVAQRAIVNLYKEWVPGVESRLIDKGKSAGITYHHAVNNITNFSSGAKHSEDTIVKPSYIKLGAAPTNSGIADLSNVDCFVADSGPTGSPDDSKICIRFVGNAAEPILPVAAPIQWRFSVGISKNDPIHPQFFMQGVHNGFPAYEIYINGRHPSLPHTKVLEWKPDLTVGVMSLVGFPDTPIGTETGLINQ